MKNMNTTRPSTDEIVRRGQQIYESRIRATVEREHFGEYLVLDVETGEYEIDKDHFAASKRAAAKRPDGLRYALRIGYRTAGRIGARSRTASP